LMPIGRDWLWRLESCVIHEIIPLPPNTKNDTRLLQQD